LKSNPVTHTRATGFDLFEKNSNCYLLQHEDPSSGCAQQAPSFSSFVLLGVQQTAASFFGVQHDEAATSIFLSEIFVF
jgi:hypothetical protein